MEILGVKISEVNLSSAIQKAQYFLLSSGQNKIYTPNPEMIVLAQKDQTFREVLNRGDLNLCDGFGLWLATRLSFRARSKTDEESLSQLNDGQRSFASLSMTKQIERITGVDFMLEICKMAEVEGKSVYFFGSGSDIVIEKLLVNLKKKFPKLIVAGADSGPKVNGKGETLDQKDYIEVINKARPDILFVAFGMGKQEKWIDKNLSKMPSVKIAMGVGGSFEYISGTIKRAPCWMRKIGLEWMYRLFRQPSRFLRILNATIKFCSLIFFKDKN